MNHEKRIASLEKQVKQLKEIIDRAGLNEEFIPLAQAARQLKVNPWVIRDRIKADENVELGEHFKMNGSRYLINVSEWKKLIASDVRAKRL